MLNKWNHLTRSDYILKFGINPFETHSSSCMLSFFFFLLSVLVIFYGKNVPQLQKQQQQQQHSLTEEHFAGLLFWLINKTNMIVPV